ncbi:microsomal glutathione S-transferase 1 [Copidosoma floridanum]|uniref:microsomal glutathione S-transferase 1 n=1 Tax=Copidosoma floridanum TaxID=29053 RepID=UPI0006C95F3F|nr:microsomal glutathione S-transferase 1 [Copidosoma floridanum]XP_014213631.1 microsomal glutathione S-transferase 1 [Copidosoma floridanum]
MGLLPKFNAEPYNSEIMKVYTFWVGVLTLKLLAMSLLTARMRFRKKVFANHEDTKFAVKGRVTYDDEDVERIRRSHLNDLENILPWVAITYVFLGIGPPNWLAKVLINTFVLSRIGHTLSYAIYSKQPYRAIFFFTGFAITALQALAAIFYSI